jgi:DNA-binding NarL/FixJ family response regulator
MESVKPVKILLVDDHPLFLEGIQNLLTARGFQVVGTAGDGLEALAKARALRPDLILMDVQMPRCDGLAATRMIKAEMPDVKIVMLTVSEDDADLFEAVKSGACGYLLKNLDARMFFDLLSRVMQGEAPLAPGMTMKILTEFARQAGGGPVTAPKESQAAPALSSRQMEILTLAARGLTYKEVGEALCLSERTVKYHVGEILKRLHLKNRVQLIAYAVQMGWVGGRH